MLYMFLIYVTKKSVFLYNPQKTNLVFAAADLVPGGAALLAFVLREGLKSNSGVDENSI